jgi:hypothetical protein
MWELLIMLPMKNIVLTNVGNVQFNVYTYIWMIILLLIRS